MSKSWHAESSRIGGQLAPDEIEEMHDYNHRALATLFLQIPAIEWDPTGESRMRSQLHADNLQRWRQSGEPAEWVRRHPNGWNHQDWLGLLDGLRKSSYWPMEENAIGQTIESLHKRGYIEVQKEKIPISPKCPKCGSGDYLLVKETEGARRSFNRGLGHTISRSYESGHPIIALAGVAMRVIRHFAPPPTWKQCKRCRTTFDHKGWL